MKTNKDIEIKITKKILNLSEVDYIISLNGRYLDEFKFDDATVELMNAYRKWENELRPMRLHVASQSLEQPKKNYGEEEL